MCFESFVRFRLVIEKSMESDDALGIDPTCGMDSPELKLPFLLHWLISSITFIIKVHLITLHSLAFILLFLWIELIYIRFNDFKDKTITIAFYYYQ